MKVSSIPSVVLDWTQTQFKCDIEILRKVEGEKVPKEKEEHQNIRLDAF